MRGWLFVLLLFTIVLLIVAFLKNPNSFLEEFFVVGRRSEIEQCRRWPPAAAVADAVAAALVVSPSDDTISVFGNVIRLSKLKTGSCSFGGKKNFSGALFSSHIFAECKIKKTHKDEPWRRWPWPLPPPLGRPRPVSIAAFS